MGEAGQRGHRMSLYYFSGFLWDYDYFNIELKKVTHEHESINITAKNLKQQSERPERCTIPPGDGEAQ